MSSTIPREVLSATTILAPLISSATAGSILTLSYFPLPIIRSVTTSNTAEGLDHLKALFSSGSHIYPPLATIASGLYALLAYADPSKRSGYVAAAVGSFGIAPFTVLVMLPLANQRLLNLHEKRKKLRGEVDGDREEVLAVLKKFEWLNAVRAAIMAVGAVVGLYTALL